MAKIKIHRVEGTFKGFNIASSGLATIKFRAPYSEIATYLNLIGLQDRDLILAVRESNDSKFQKVGIVRLKEIKFKGDDGADFIFKGEKMEIPTFDSFLDKVVVFAVKPIKDGDD